LVTPSAVITGIATAFPESAEQRELFEGFFAAHFGNRRAAAAAFAGSGVQTRHAAANPLTEDISSWSTAQRMERYAVEALPLGRDALSAALADAGLAADELGLLAVASCTGYATPGIDVQLARELKMADSLQRLLVGHVGCHAALPALASVADYVTAHQRPAALLCVELPSLHLQPATTELDQIVSHALFSDAAAAIIVEPHGGVGSLEIVDVAARSDTDAADQMTWIVTDRGFRMTISRHVPDVLAVAIPLLLDDLLVPHELRPDLVSGWAVHPGGPRILDAVEATLGLPTEALEPSRRVLAEHGNCSSATVLVVLDALRQLRRGASGEHLVALAFGPGLTAYATLLRSG
jgi:alkylresorcinol/alkylpyrone synthase